VKNASLDYEREFKPITIYRKVGGGGRGQSSTEGRKLKERVDPRKQIKWAGVS